jgi:hypothetical protein
MKKKRKANSAEAEAKAAAEADSARIASESQGRTQLTQEEIQKLTPEERERLGISMDAPSPDPRLVAHPDPVIAAKIAESRKSLTQPLQPGQQFFETPEGEILVGEEGKGQIWSRTMNGGKGGWANARRFSSVNPNPNPLTPAAKKEAREAEEAKAKAEKADAAAAKAEAEAKAKKAAA